MYDDNALVNPKFEQHARESSPWSHMTKVVSDGILAIVNESKLKEDFVKTHYELILQSSQCNLNNGVSSFLSVIENSIQFNAVDKEEILKNIQREAKTLGIRLQNLDLNILLLSIVDDKMIPRFDMFYDRSKSESRDGRNFAHLIVQLTSYFGYFYKVRRAIIISSVIFNAIYILYSIAVLYDRNTIAVNCKGG